MKIVALVLAGGEGTRLYPLTAEHAKPALPFANGYRIVDFVLSNLVNSRISNIYVLAQYKPESLVRHIEAAWAPWLAEEWFVKVLLPRSNTLAGRFKGTADAVYQYLDVIQAHSPDVVAIRPDGCTSSAPIINGDAERASVHSHLRARYPAADVGDVQPDALGQRRGQVAHGTGVAQQRAADL